MMLAISGVFAKDNKAGANKPVTAKGTNISVTYEQPSKNGRVIFGKPEDNPVMAYGKVWDVPAAQITFTKDCLVGGNKRQLKAGTYSVFIRPAQGEWIFIFNSQPKLTNAADLEKNKDKTILQTWGLTKKLDNVVEAFTITPQKDGLLVEWDQSSVLFPVEFVGK